MAKALNLVFGVIIAILLYLVVILSIKTVYPDLSFRGTMLSDSKLNQDNVKNNIGFNNDLEKGQIICDLPYIKQSNVCCLDINKNKLCDVVEKDNADFPVAVLPSTSTLPEVKRGTIVEGNIVCGFPYIRHAEGCCLDTNNNAICDRDEIATPPASIAVSEEAPAVESATESLPASVTINEEAPAVAIANDSLTVSASVVSGCTDAAATNYDSVATVDTGNCVFLRTTSPENTGVLCSDGVDNDGDGALDELDSNCKGVSCSGGVIVWSYSPGENQNVAPPANSNGVRRIGCCAPTDCRTRDGAGECIPYDQPYTSTYGWICGNNNNWDRCGTATGTNKGDGVVSEGGGYVCETNPVGWLEYSVVSLVTTTPLCTDSDGGLNVTTRGTTTGPGGPNISLIVTRVDSCTSYGRVLEQFCAQGSYGHSFVNDQVMNCPSGKSCVSGRCVFATK